MRMNTNTKRLLCAGIALLLAAALAACNLVTVNEEKDNAQIVAKVGDVEITKGEALKEYNDTLSYYLQFGYNPDEQAKKELIESVVDGLISDKVLELKALEQGFATLNDEDQAEINNTVQEEMQYLKEYIQQYVDAEKLDDPALDEEVRAKQLFFEISGYTPDVYENMLKEEYGKSYPVNKLRKAHDEKITVSEQEIAAAFAQMLEEDKEAYTEYPGSFRGEQEDFEQYGGAVQPLYVPAGYIRVRMIDISPEGELSMEYTEKINRMELLKNELGALSLEKDASAPARSEAEIKAEYDALRAETDSEYEAFISPARTKIQEAYDKLLSGEDFKSVMLAYTQDDRFLDVEAFQEKGMLMSAHESAPDWAQELKDAAFSLTPGAYTGIIELEDGFHIVQYVSNVGEQTLTLDMVRASVEEQALTTKKNDEWNALITAWMEDQTLVTRYQSVIDSIAA